MSSVDILYLSGCNEVDTKRVSVSIETYIAFFVYQYCELDLKVCVLDTDEIFYPCTIPSSLFFKLGNFHSLENCSQDLNFLFPAIVIEQGKTVIAGLCAVLRWAIKSYLTIHPDHYCSDLLGFRGGCLVACTESSIWTKFCELQLPRSVQEVSLKIRNGQSVEEIPESLIILEAHLKRPVRTHNILKRKLDIAKKIRKKGNSHLDDTGKKSESDTDFILYDEYCSPLDKNDIQQRLQNMVITEKSEEFALDHSYLEGIDFTLADLIVFPCIYYLLNLLPLQASNHLINVKKWYERMWNSTLVKRAANKCGMILNSVAPDDMNIENFNIFVPDIDQISLYKRDPSHTRLKCKHQSPDKIISFLQSKSIEPKYNMNYCTQLNWDSLPSMLHPANGDLPLKRLERKCQQIESIVTAILKIAKENQTIVEFCAGGGHVGLLLAYFLPTCKVLLIENKESSMMRAKSRAHSLKLKNVSFYQGRFRLHQNLQVSLIGYTKFYQYKCNLDYFKGSFDIGISLHACGVATDLVIKQCINKQASFVCCPCCYGCIQDTHLLNYPLSKTFKSSGLSKKDYTLLAHFADRTEVNTPTAEQGEICMGLVDTDRTYYAQEQEYKVDLTMLQPITCSPKHNLLIGISAAQMKS